MTHDTLCVFLTPRQSNARLHISHTSSCWYSKEEFKCRGTDARICMVAFASKILLYELQSLSRNIDCLAHNFLGLARKRMFTLCVATYAAPYLRDERLISNRLSPIMYGTVYGVEKVAHWSGCLEQFSKRVHVGSKYLLRVLDPEDYDHSTVGRPASSNSLRTHLRSQFLDREHQGDIKDKDDDD
eukprot:IDg5578t1